MRLLAVLLFAQARPVAEITQLLRIAKSTFYAWLPMWLGQGLASLRPRRAPGRKPKLTAQQKHRLRDLLLAGPEQNGFACGVWNAALVQLLIAREFKVRYNQHYVCALLAGARVQLSEGPFYRRAAR